MTDIKRLISLGILSWLIPFLASILFYGPGGTLLIGYDLFKSLMIVIGSGIGALLLVFYYRTVQDAFRREAWIVGGTWLLLNWTLDLFFLLPLSKQTIGSYFGEIGLRYLSILFMGLAIGYTMERAGPRTERGS
ncbi:MAG: hypothetical protein LUO93_04895 [Methanomicrobiales archaeon]|nr:hypothetical protein [Methanomicrobiales archaeon]